MRSYLKAASLVALSTLGLLVHSQEIVQHFNKEGGTNGGFMDSLSALNTLTAGPYPQAKIAAYGMTPNPEASLMTLFKRQSGCNPGYYVCGYVVSSPGQLMMLTR